jgi:flagellum-specific ATP synthase
MIGHAGWGLAGLEEGLRAIQPVAAEGRLREVSGDRLVIGGLTPLLAVGDGLRLRARGGGVVRAEVTGFLREGVAASPLDPIADLGPGAPVRLCRPAADLHPADGWIGRVVDPFGLPLDGRGPLPRGERRTLRGSPIAATRRGRLGAPLPLGITVLDLFTPCRAGQRFGLFAGAGIGKSTLLGMLARNAACDVAVLGLVGERGREVREFLEDELGPDGRARTVAVVATSDMPPIVRRNCAEAAVAVAEHFRDQGKHVLLLIDSLTRYCTALHEIGLAAGELPAARGFPPSVFAQLPRLLERAGPGAEAPDRKTGQITAIFSVLVDGDDQTEPVADAVRGFLDGHIVLDRSIAERGRYPAVDVLRSLSRAAPGCLTAEDATLMQDGRRAIARAAETDELVKLGAYRAGSDPELDRALERGHRIDALLVQAPSEHRDHPFAALRDALG